MKEKILIFGEDNINKNIFHKHKQAIDINKVDIKRTVACDKSSYDNKGSFKCFIGYKVDIGIMHKAYSNKWIC